mgnify:CR=1 FL=1
MILLLTTGIAGPCSQDENNRVPKICLDSKVVGKRRVRRPKLQWFNDAQDNIRKRGIKRWRSKAQDRQEWMTVLREAKVKLKIP